MGGIGGEGGRGVGSEVGERHVGGSEGASWAEV